MSGACAPDNIRDANPGHVFFRDGVSIHQSDPYIRHKTQIGHL